MTWRLIYVQLELPYRVLTDEAWYIGQARQLFTSHAWTSIFNATPTAQHGPLTSVFLSPVAWLVPHTVVGLRDVMAVLGGVTVVMMGLAGRELGGVRAGLWAAGLAAVIPDFWIRDGLVVSEPVAALLVVTAVWVALRCRRGVTWRRTTSLGVLAGLLSLTRPEIVLAVFVIAAVVVVRHGTTATPRWRHVVVVVLVAAVVVAPWSLYNAGRFRDTVTLTNNLGITLAGANCERTYYDLAIMGYDSPVCWNAANARAVQHGGDESVQSAFMRHEAQTFVSGHLSRVPLVVGMREVWFLGLYRPGWVVHLGTVGGQPAWATWLQAVSFWFLFAAALALWWRHRRDEWPHWLLGVLMGNSFIVAALFVGHWRYRVTLDVGMVLLLALAVGRPRLPDESATTPDVSRVAPTG